MHSLLSLFLLSFDFPNMATPFRLLDTSFPATIRCLKNCCDRSCRWGWNWTSATGRRLSVWLHFSSKILVFSAFLGRAIATSRS